VAAGQELFGTLHAEPGARELRCLRPATTTRSGLPSIAARSAYVLKAN